MTNRFILFTGLILFSCSSQLQGQVNWGGVLRNVGEQIQNDIRQEIQQGIGQVLPGEVGPPNTVLPYPDYGYVPPVQTYPTYPEPTYTYPQPVYGAPVYSEPPIVTYSTPPIVVPSNSTVVQPGATSPRPTNSNAAPGAGNPNATTTAASKKPAPKKRLPVVKAGEIVKLSGRQYGEKAGKVYLKINSLVMEAETLGWESGRVQAKLPYLPVKEPVEAIVIVANAEEKVADVAHIQLTPGSPDQGASAQSSQKAAPAKKAEPSPLPTVAAGQSLHIKGQLGEEKGSVNLQVGSLKIPVNIAKWAPDRVDFALPEIGVEKTSKATVVVLRADKSVVKSVDVMLGITRESTK